MKSSIFHDWGEASEVFDDIKEFVGTRNLADANEAQTRFDVIDRLIREVLGWQHGQVTVEEALPGQAPGYVDYILRCGDDTIVIEAKKVGVSFPSVTKKRKMKLSGSVLGAGQIGDAIKQAQGYAARKKATFVIVTNGICWCYFPTANLDEDSYANLLFPFGANGHAEILFNTFSLVHVEKKSLQAISNQQPYIEHRLITTVKRVDGRVDRNRIADYLNPALNKALYSEWILADEEVLRQCYVDTDARRRFDSQLGLYLADLQPMTAKPAERIKRDRSRGPLERIVRTSVSSSAPPVTLIIGPVGAGKSTYLRHFELVSGQTVLQSKDAHWIYIDFEEMGRAGNPRDFIYDILKSYLERDHPSHPTDWDSVGKAAYQEKFDALARGPMRITYTRDKDEYYRLMQEEVAQEYRAVEPYVDRILRYIAQQQLCMVVLDNVDLYEDDELETRVFAEGLALSKRVHCNVIVSLRDTTFARHHSDSTFNAYELHKLWLDPPDFKAVLSRRFSYSKIILADQSGSFDLDRVRVNIADLSGFFDVVQQSLLDGPSGDFIEAMADLNIRKGIELVKSFLTSGHIEADRAVKNYVTGHPYTFPYHEVFKGSMLGQWRHFREDRARCINVFDARLGSRQLQLLRLFVLNELAFRARTDDSGVSTDDLVRLFSDCGASQHHVIAVLEFLRQEGLIRSTTAEAIDIESIISITRSGGYLCRFLTRKFPYVEECMYDTAIFDDAVWTQIEQLTQGVEQDPDKASRFQSRKERIEIFLTHLVTLESESLFPLRHLEHLQVAESIQREVMAEVQQAIRRTDYRYSRSW